MPVACERDYRLIALRKLVPTDKEQLRLFDDYRSFLFLTNDRDLTAREVVLGANQRCNQENLIAQLKSGVHALATPVDTLLSNWAYMVMASLAWNLKAWSALLVPESPRLPDLATYDREPRVLFRSEAEKPPTSGR